MNFDWQHSLITVKRSISLLITFFEKAKTVEKDKKNGEINPIFGEIEVKSYKVEVKKEVKRPSKKEKSSKDPESSAIKKAEEEFLKSQMSVAISTTSSGIQLDPDWKKEVKATKKRSSRKK